MAKNGILLCNDYAPDRYSLAGDIRDLLQQFYVIFWRENSVHLEFYHGHFERNNWKYIKRARTQFSVFVKKGVLDQE